MAITTYIPQAHNRAVRQASELPEEQNPERIPKGRNRESIRHADDGDIRVSYDYDPVGQVTTVHHPNGTVTTYTYDQIGQKLRITHPDAGEVTTTYDAAGNLLSKLTSQLKETISDKAPITYTYDYERLSEVLYPENLFNRVTYTYGAPGDKYNRAGRLSLVEDASGGEAYYYGRMGEVIKTVRSVMASTADIRTYVYSAEYDSWNRVRTMTYPDGEVVTYHYNEAGQINGLSSNKQGTDNVIVETIGYDKEGHTVYTKLGNGTETRYTYDNERQRLQEMTLTSGDNSLMHNRYTYDAVDNILGISNAVDPQELFDSKSKLGGASLHSYQYDNLNRLISATGKAKNASYTLSMSYNHMSMPVMKSQQVDSSLTAVSYDMAYLYEDQRHPTAPTQIGHEHYTYDANGNPVLVENDSTSETRELYWDEDNRLMVLSDNGKTSRYTYNHSGERIVKSHGTMEGVYINGAPQGITFHETDEFTLYPASIISVSKNRYTKHYFIGNKRVASRIGSGSFNNVYGMNGCNITAGQQDYAERLNQIESQKEDYYRELGIAPGIPTMKGSFGDPENTGVGYNTIIRNLGDHSVPAEWVEYVKKNENRETAPGAPIAWEQPSQPEEVQPGYGFIPDNESSEETFYYHSDHLGSTSYVTDDSARITQYTAYLPYGELLVDEHSSSEDMPYKFNGKELDEETGLYYYGARYMQPIASIWYGIDPLTEKYPEISGYVYCHGNPINIIDPNGCDEFEVNSDGKITKVVNNNSPQITITESNGDSKSFSDYEIKPYFFGLGNATNRKIITNVANYYVRKMKLDCDISISDENKNSVLSYYDFNDKKIYICPSGTDKPNSSLNNKYNLMNTLYHEYNHKLDDEKGLFANHYLHASVVERASSHWTFAKTDYKYIWGQADYFSQLAMNAYYHPNKNTKDDVMNLITKFNKTNKGGIKLQFDPINQKMNITIGSSSIDRPYIESRSRKNTF